MLGLIVVVVLGAMSGPARSAPITAELNVEVSGEVLPGEETVFAFQGLPPGQRVYLQRTAASNAGQLSWSIEDAFGRIIADSATAINDLGPVALMGGDYRLIVRGRQPTSAGSFSFILHGVSDTASSLQPDQLDQRSFSGVGATHRYTLNLAQPGPVHLFFDIATTNQLSYRLVDGLGNVREDWTNSGPLATAAYALPAGSHQIEVRGRNNFAGEYSLRVRQAFDSPLQPLPLNGAAEYQSADVSETAGLAFTLDEPARVYPQFLFSHPTSAAQWRLERSDGLELVDWAGNLNPIAEPLTLMAGDYVLSVRSRLATAVEGSVVLHEVVDSETVLEPDQPTQGVILTPGQTQRFLISNLPSGVYLLQRLETSNNSGLRWSIEDATGRPVLAETTNVNSIEEIALIGGDYTLVLTGNNAGTGSVDFALITGTEATAPTALGATIDDAIAQSAEIRRYAFTAPANRRLTIERIASSNTANLNLRLEDALGREILPRTSNLPASISVDLMGGEYVLSVLGQSGATGSYSLLLNDEGNTDFLPSGTALMLNAPASGTVSTGAPERWLLSLDEAARVYLNLTQGGSGLRWSLFDAAGQPLFVNQAATTAGLGGRGPFMLLPGDYVVELALPSGSPVSYGFTAVAAAVQQTVIGLDEAIDSQPVVPGFRNEYFFNLADDGTHLFEVLQGNSNLRWRLEDDAGREVFSRSATTGAAASRGPFALRAGSYRLVFDAQSGAAPDYRFQVHTVLDQIEAVSLGIEPLELSDSLAMPGQRHRYDLTVLPGEGQLYLQVLAGSSELRYTLTDPAGRELVSDRRLLLPNSDDSGPLPLVAGDYKLTIRATGPTTPAYSLVVHRVAPPAVLAGVLDQDESWINPQPGERRRYSFTLSQPSTGLAFRSLAAASNVFVTLVHEDSGWAPLSDSQLQALNATGRGPFSLPPGSYHLELFARGAVGGDPAWRLVEVIDPEPQPLAVNEVQIVGFPMPGARLSYLIEPQNDGQALIFDLMETALGNQWTLTDPVGTVVFGPANAANFTLHDQGPVALASGVYTLVFNNPTLQTPDWFFRVRPAVATITVPDGCAACSELDIVFAFDTSGSMSPVNQAMCDLAEELVAVLADDGIPINPVYWGIGNSAGGSCLSSDIATELGPEVPGTPPPWMTTLFECVDGAAGPLENWAPATAILAERYPWTEGAVRLVMPVADEGPYCGDPVNEFDIEAVFYARDFALANDIVVSPLMPDFTPDPVRAMAELITIGTGGIATVADFGLDVLPTARAIAFAACGTQQAIATPSITEVSPLPGSLLPSGVPLTLSGRVIPVNQLRPVLEVEVNGQPSSVLDSAGSFFATITLAPGPNTVTISALEACGPTVLEIELYGAGDASDPWSGFGEVSNLLQPRFRRTTFDRSGQRLLVDVAVANTGASLNGPILMAVGLDLHPGVNLLNADGFTPNGEPYVILIPEGETLGAGAESPARELAFANPDGEAIDFEPRWLAPANQPPVFTSIPLTRATLGREWRYPVSVEDGNGDEVTLSLLVAPAGMSLTGQTLSWTPSQAGSADVIIRASDGRGGVARQSFTVQVVEPGFNAPPLFTSSPVIQAPIGASYVYAANAVDPDGDPLTFSLASAPAGMVVDSASGLVSWSPAVAGQHSVILVVDDGQGGEATQSFTLFVGEPATTPAGPAFASTPITVAAAGTQYRYRYSLNTAAGPEPSVSLVEAPVSMSLDSASRTVTWVPDSNDLGSHVVELLAVDAAGQTARQRFQLTVLESLPNQPPYFTSSPSLAAVVGQPWTYAAEAVDPEFQPLQFSLAAAPAGMSVDSDSGVLAWTPVTASPNAVDVSLVATDPEGAEAVQQFTLQVRAGNGSPVLSTTPPETVFIGQTYSHLFLASDPDGDALRYTLLSGPPGMTLDPEAGWLSWPTAGFTPGNYAFEVVVEDDWGGQDLRAFSVLALEDTQPPTVAVVIERQPACAGESVQVCLQASDNVGLASRALRIDGQSQNLVANCVSWTPTVPGNALAIGTATDTSGLTTDVERLLQVADCNDEQRPVVSLVSPQPETLITQPTPLIVSIDDNTPEALTWTVWIRAGEDGEPEILAEGTGPVSETAVALIDPSRLPEGDYRIGVLGSDGVQTGGIEFRINVGGRFKPGRLLFAAADATLPVAGIPLSFGRIYDSLEAGPHGQSTGDFGPGWRLSLSASVRDSARESPFPDNPMSFMLVEPFSDDTRVYVVKPNGERVGFTFAPKPRGFPAAFQFDVHFEPDPGVTDTLRAVDGPDVVWSLGAGYADFIVPYNPSIYELETADRLVYVISESEGLLEVRDALGGVLTVSRDGVQSSRGLSVDYVRDSQGRIVEIVLPPAEPGAERGRLLYGYDAIGNLVSMTDLAGGVSLFEYSNPDYPHHLTAMIDSLGNTVSQHVFDDDGRAIATCPADGNLATLEGCNQFGFDLAGGFEVVFDGRGFRSELYYNDAGLLSARRDWIDGSEWVEQLWIYDESGRLLEYVDAEGGRTLSSYDEQGRELSREFPGGQLATWTYGDCGRDWISLTDALGNTSQREFDDHCRLRFQIDPLDGVTEFQYDDSGQRTAVIDPLGQVWAFEYNDLGLISRITDPSGAVETRSYNGLGLETSRVDRSGQQVQWVHDQAGRLLSQTAVGTGQSYSWEYNVRGLITRESGPHSTLDFEYWPTGRLRRVDFSGPNAPSWWVSYEYDGNGNTQLVSDSLGGLVSHDYDGLNRLTAMTFGGAGVNPKRVEFESNRNGLIERLQRYASQDNSVPGPLSDISYVCPSCASQTARITHRRPDGGLIHDLEFVRNGNGEIIQMVDTHGSHQFVYDGRGWLVESSHPSLPGLSSGAIHYDAMGNWLSLPGRPGPVTLSYQVGSGGHQLLADGVASYNYNARGALLSRVQTGSGETLTIDYDGFERPAVVALTDTAANPLATASYRYTATGLRIFAELDGVRRHFVFDGDNVIAALDDTGQVVWRRFHSRAVDRPLAEQVGGNTRWLLFDHLGSVRNQVDNAGQVLAEFAYTPFGRQVLGPPSSVDDAVRFTGREFDVPGGLAYYRARLYDPAAARFVSEDPIEPWHYRYAENNPMRFTDPTGEVAAIEYALLICDRLGEISLGKGIGEFFIEAMSQVVGGFSGIPGDPQKALKKLKSVVTGTIMPCGLDAP
ncbi:MAG: putative Ig domain-containing protein [Wenzhouxiangella sp.]